MKLNKFFVLLLAMVSAICTACTSAVANSIPTTTNTLQCTTAPQPTATITHPEIIATLPVDPALETVTDYSTGMTVTLNLSHAQIMIAETSVEYGWVSFNGVLYARSYTDGFYLEPVCKSDRYMYVIVDGGYTYLADAQIGEVFDPLAVLDIEVRQRLSDVRFSSDGQFAVVSYNSGTECVLIQCTTGQITQLPYEQGLYCISGSFLDDDNVLLSSSYEIEPHKIMYTLSVYDISTGECTQLPGQYQAKNRNEEQFLAVYNGGSAITFSDGGLIVIDLLTWQSISYPFATDMELVFDLHGRIYYLSTQGQRYLLNKDGTLKLVN